jgi:hypothetical protein
MTDHSRIKTSSRAGRFKKKLVSEEALMIEAPAILSKVAPFQELLASTKISESDFTAAYLLLYLSHRFPGAWLGAKREQKKIPGIPWRSLPFYFEPNIERRLKEVESLQEIFASFALKSTPLTVNRAILEWSKGNYSLELMFRIPRPHEVLDQQKLGRRCVTTVVDQRVSKYILGERDSLSFTMHDLIHADHFYYHNECYQGQLGFYGLLDKTISYFDLSNEKFASEFEYVIADMNAYPVHLLKCLKSALIHYFDETYFRDWLKGLNAPAAMYALNTTTYSSQDMDREILSWLDSFRFHSLHPARNVLG